MKKLRSNSKRKWIVGGVMFFGGIGLLTTGFATWVVGTQVLNQQNNIGITVDTADSDSVSMKATFDGGTESFHLGEQNVAAGPSTIVSADEKGSPTDLKIVFSSIKIETTTKHFNDHYGETKPFSMSFKTMSTVATGQDTNVLTANTVTENKVDKADANPDLNIRTGSSWTYLDLSDLTFEVTPNAEFKYQPIENGPKITMDKVPAWQDESTLKTLTLSNVVIEYNWGTFFDNKAPTDFYNDPANFAKLKGSLLKQEAIKEELNAMSDALTGNNFYFELKLIEA